MASVAASADGGSSRGCSVCGAGRGLLACGGCRGVWYCGAEHQRQHWPQHRAACLPYEVKTNETLGRHLVATRSIKRGALVLKEEALLVAPVVALKHGRKVNSCPGCCRILPPSEFLWSSCHDCGVPLCSSSCKLKPGSLHTQAECDALKAANVKAGFPKHLILAVLRPLRGLLLSGAKARHLKSLHSNEDLAVSQQSLPFISTLDFTNQYVTAMFGPKFETADIRFVTGVIETNCFAYDYMESSGDAVFPKISLLAHSCHPNARFVVLRRGESELSFSAAVYASVDIARGETITVTYVRLTKPTSIRRELLLEDKLFFCRCDRCEDPTELALNYESICCVKCHERKAPMSILEAKGTDDASECVCGACGYRTTFKEVRSFLRSLASGNASALDGTRPDAIEKFLKRHLYPEGLCHPNLWLIFDMRDKLINGMPSDSASNAANDMMMKHRDRRLSLCREQLFVLRKLYPGLTSQTRCALIGVASSLLGIVMEKAHNLGMTKKPANPCNLVARRLKSMVFEAKTLYEEARTMLAPGEEDSTLDYLRDALSAVNKIIG